MRGTHAPLSRADALTLLSEGEITVEGLIPWSSNATLLVTARLPGLTCLAVYKPQRGERPLWDFATGTLGKREVAAYLVSEALGWDLVPPTLLREGPLGLGSVQLYVRAQEDAHYFTIREEGTHGLDLMRLVALDAAINNADRKSGHCLEDLEGHVWAIDNALTFHVLPKLRTVIWDYAGTPLPANIQDDLRRVRDDLQSSAGLGRALAALITDTEIGGLLRRLESLIQSGRFPEPGPGRAVPWPLV
ncbi:MAG TPA: SCO1664 family protein [Anaerolineae bacterium]|nr:SCO1664 family protein [Anaerolineae bacterium]